MTKKQINKSQQKDIKDAEVETTPTKPPVTENQKVNEQQRQRDEFRWENNVRELKNKLKNIDLSTYVLSRLYKVLDDLFNSYSVVKGKSIVNKDTPVQLINGVDTVDLPLGELMKFIKEKAKQTQDENIGFGFQSLVITKYNDNPYLHPLAKSLSIEKMSDEWLESHSFIIPEVYDLISKGFVLDGDLGFWNTDFEKAHKDLSKYKKVRKLVYRDGKSYIMTVYENNLVPVKGEDEIALESHPEIISHAKEGLSEGDTVAFIDKEGERVTGVIENISYHSKTDKFGKAEIRLKDGTKISKSLKLVRTISDEEKSDTLGSSDKPLKLSDFKTPGTSLGGSSDVKLMRSKDDKFYAVKKARLKDGEYANGQLEQETLADKLYQVIGLASPDSYLIKEDNVTYKIAPYIEKAQSLSCTGSSDYKEVQKGFVMDALLGNWDVIGAGYDNILTKDGEIIRIDNGGSLEYRAKGRKKSDSDFGPEIVELTSFLNEGTNPTTAAVFGGITKKEIQAQAKSIIENRKKIEGLVLAFETHTTGHKGLYNKIHKRLEWLEKNIVEPEIPKEEFDSAKYPSIATQDYFKDWDKFEIEGNPEIKEAIKKQILKIEERNKSLYKSFADKKGLSIGAYKILLQKHVEELMLDSEYFIKTDINILDKILHKEGKYKSQFEMKFVHGKESSHGSYDPFNRSETEHEYFGFEDDIRYKPQDRPIYGYCSSNVNGVNNSSGQNPPGDNASNYGEVTVKIKTADALKKATVIFNDSLGDYNNIAATPASKPHFTSLRFSIYDSDPLEIKNTCERPSYTELQYHNQLNFHNIESIHMTPNSTTYRGEVYENINKMIKIGRETDVPIVIFNNK